MSIENLGYVATEDGRFVSSDHIRIAEILQDYDPDLHLAWIPPENRGPGDTKIWGVFFKQHLVARFEECDHRILAYIWSGDSQKHDVLANIEAEEAAKRAIELKKQMEEAELRQDHVVSALKSPLHYYKMENGSKLG
jgi:hypothetical protein